MISLDHLLMDSQAAGAAIAAARLLSLGHAKRQPALLAFLLTTAATLVLLTRFPLDSAHYFWAYLLSQAITDILAIAVVRELFLTIVVNYPGIQTAAGWVMTGAITVSALASLILRAALWGTGASQSSHLYYDLRLHWFIHFSLAVVVISLLIFLSHYPLRLQKNTYLFAYFFSAAVLIDAADTLIAILSPDLFSKQIDMAAVVAVGICFIGWAAVMRAHEALPTQDKGANPIDNDLLRQLESLNRTLSRVGRR